MKYFYIIMNHCSHDLSDVRRKMNAKVNGFSQGKKTLVWQEIWVVLLHTNSITYCYVTTVVSRAETCLVTWKTDQTRLNNLYNLQLQRLNRRQYRRQCRRLCQQHYRRQCRRLYQQHYRRQCRRLYQQHYRRQCRRFRQLQVSTVKLLKFVTSAFLGLKYVVGLLYWFVLQQNNNTNDPLDRNVCY